MTDRQIEAAQAKIESEPDASIQAVLTAALVSEVFRAAGYEPVIVGGSAIEVYTEGDYRSGDVDICFDGLPRPDIEKRTSLMRDRLHATGSMRQWKVGKQFVDLLGELESVSVQELRSLETPLGKLVLMPIEELIVERVFIARGWNTPNPDAENCARKLIACALRGEWSMNWGEAERIAALPAYGCLESLISLRSEVELDLNLT